MTVPSPVHCRWATGYSPDHPIREAYFCRRNPIFKDMFRELAAFDN